MTKPAPPPPSAQDREDSVLRRLWHDEISGGRLGLDLSRVPADHPELRPPDVLRAAYRAGLDRAAKIVDDLAPIAAKDISKAIRAEAGKR